MSRDLYRPNVLLFSGGMDSTVALYHSIHRTPQGVTNGLFINYGQRHIREWQAANAVWSIAKVGYPQAVGTLHYIAIPNAIPRLGPLLDKDLPESMLHHDDAQRESPTFIPHRNMLFITLAAMWARAQGADHIITGIRGGFSDCTEEFEDAVVHALHISDPNDPTIYISSPVHISRAASLELARELPGCWGALAHTLTCFKGGVGPTGHELPCGLCLPCKRRAEGFAEIGHPDPAIERVVAARSEGAC